MVINRSSMDASRVTDSPKVGARAAERRGYGVPMEQHERDGRPASRGASRPPSGGRGPRPGGGTALAERRPAGWRRRIRTTLDLIRSNPTGRITLKIFISIAGALVVTVGIALIPLP